MSILLIEPRFSFSLKDLKLCAQFTSTFFKPYLFKQELLHFCYWDILYFNTNSLFCKSNSHFYSTCSLCSFSEIETMSSSLVILLCWWSISTVLQTLLLYSFCCSFYFVYFRSSDHFIEITTTFPLVTYFVSSPLVFMSSKESTIFLPFLLLI